LKASRTSSSGLQLIYPGGETSDALRFLVASAIQISRSVMIPMTLLEPSRIGSAPHRWLHITSANCARLLSGQHELTFLVIRSFTNMGTFVAIRVCKAASIPKIPEPLELQRRW